MTALVRTRRPTTFTVLSHLIEDEKETASEGPASLGNVGMSDRFREHASPAPRISRRLALALPAALLEWPALSQSATLSLVAPQKQEFVDPATEFKVTRWTEEGAEAALPGDLDRVLSRNDQQLLYASNRSGTWMPYILHLPSGESTLLAEAQGLQPASLAFLRGDKEVIFLDGAALVRSQLRRPRVREVYRANDGWMPSGKILLSPDDRSVAVHETRGESTRIVFVELGSGKSRTVIETASGSLAPFDIHPRYGLLLLDSRQTPVFQGGTVPNPLSPFPAGLVLQARFNQAGDHLTYLLRSPGPPERTMLMEVALRGGRHELIANTSKFAAYSPNTNGSVFVGASDSVAQPFLLLLLRVTRREFALMEHSASKPSVVQPVFSHNSQLIFFQSDRLGKNCIFSISVKGLVEQT